MNDRGKPATVTDLQGLEELRRRLLGTVRQVCPRWLASHAEDITQEALLRVTAVIQREGDTNRQLPSSYLKKAAYSATVDTMRKHRQRREREVEMIEGQQEPTGEQVPGPAQKAAGSQIGDAIQECLSLLVEPRQVGVILHLQGHSAPEISRLTGWPETKAKNLIYRGLRNLRECMREKGLQP